MTSSDSARTASIWWRCCGSFRRATRSSASSASPGFRADRSLRPWSAVHGSGGGRGIWAASESDELGDDRATSLTDEGVDVSAAEIIAGAQTRFAMILVDGRTGDRTVLWDRDARLALTAATCRPRRCGAARVLLVDCDDVEASVAAARDRTCRRRHHGDRRRSRAAGPRSPAAADRRRDCVRGVPRAVDGIIRDRPRPRAARRGAPARADVRHARPARKPRALPGPRDSGRPPSRFPASTRPAPAMHFAAGSSRRCCSTGLLKSDVLLRMANAVAALKCRTAGAREGLPHAAELAALLACAGRYECGRGQIDAGRVSGHFRRSECAGFDKGVKPGTGREYHFHVPKWRVRMMKALPGVVAVGSPCRRCARVGFDARCR